MPVKLREVYLFKAQTDDDNDEFSFSKVIEDTGFLPKTIPVLDFEYCNLELLKDCLARPADYSGIIFTSPRAVKAVVKCLESAENCLPEWKEHSMFVVGESTKRILKNDLGLIGRCGSTENAQGLAECITQKSYNHPLLFPCSDIRRSTLPLCLSQKNVPYREITVYCTQKNPCLEEMLCNVTNGGEEYPEYLVFFSPSGVKHCLPILFQLSIPLGDTKIIAIGNATASALKEANIIVWACLSKPAPQCLLEALLGEVVKTERDHH
ncbi:Uroporphyrinogen-III synthase [Gryllus bimaculatus]|nr:Uroporphyrinogen-III synthase [Gryllus bimaculatus]